MFTCNVHYVGLCIHYYVIWYFGNNLYMLQLPHLNSLNKFNEYTRLRTFSYSTIIFQEMASMTTHHCPYNQSAWTLAFLIDLICCLITRFIHLKIRSFPIKLNFISEYVCALHVNVNPMPEQLDTCILH